MRAAGALLEAYCVEDVDDEFQNSHRRYAKTLESAARRLGSRRTGGTVGLMGYYASIGRNEAMYRFAKNTFDIARHDRPPLR